MLEKNIHVLKLGGSLLDLPDLPARIVDLIANQTNTHFAMVVGGGNAADTVRDWHDLHQLPDQTSHWLAIEAMALNTHLIASALPEATLVVDIQTCQHAWDAGLIALIDPLQWLSMEQERGIDIPHHWGFTSDAISAHIATHLYAERLTLLKSVTPAMNTMAWAVEAKMVDDEFESAATSVPSIDVINLRTKPFVRCTLRGD